MALENKAWARFCLIKIKSSRSASPDPVANLINQLLSLFAPVSWPPRTGYFKTSPKARSPSFGRRNR